jgi:hypothetical protein
MWPRRDNILRSAYSHIAPVSNSLQCLELISLQHSFSQNPAVHIVTVPVLTIFGYMSEQVYLSQVALIQKF